MANEEQLAILKQKYRGLEPMVQRKFVNFC